MIAMLRHPESFTVALTGLELVLPLEFCYIIIAGTEMPVRCTAKAVVLPVMDRRACSILVPQDRGLIPALCHFSFVGFQCLHALIDRDVCVKIL